MSLSIAEAERTGALKVFGHAEGELFVFALELSDELAGELVLLAHEHGLKRVHVTTGDGEEILTVCQVLRGGGAA